MKTQPSVPIIALVGIAVTLGMPCPGPTAESQSFLVELRLERGATNEVTALPISWRGITLQAAGPAKWSKAAVVVETQVRNMNEVWPQEKLRNVRVRLASINGNDTTDEQETTWDYAGVEYGFASCRPVTWVFPVGDGTAVADVKLECTVTRSKENKLSLRSVLADPEVKEYAVPDPLPERGEVAVFCPHAGGIEVGTEQIGRYIVGGPSAQGILPGTALWVMSGRKREGNYAAFHITSTQIDPCVSPDRLLRLLKTFHTGIAIHGYTPKTPTQAIVVGGLNADGLKDVILERLRRLTDGDPDNGEFADQYTVADTAATDDADEYDYLAGRSPRNFVNRFADYGAEPGVQIEFPRSLRNSAIVGQEEGTHDTGRVEGDAKLLCEALREVVKKYCEDRKQR